jgi:hypothetical protein
VSTAQKSIHDSNLTPEVSRRDSREKWLAMIGFLVVTVSAVALFFPK